jgi:hypothetical protein
LNELFLWWPLGDLPCGLDVQFAANVAPCQPNAILFPYTSQVLVAHAFVAALFITISIAMKFRFPIVIIDEDFRSENTSGLGIRALAQAIETEGFEVLGVTSYGAG